MWKAHINIFPKQAAVIGLKYGFPNINSEG